MGPEDYNKGEEQEPNDYALRYLFKPKKPGLEWWRTTRAIIYCGAAANLLATLMLPIALEFRFPLWLLFFSFAIIITSGLGALKLWKKKIGHGGLILTLSPFIIFLLGLGYAWFTVLEEIDRGLIFFYLPGSFSMFLGGVYLFRQKSYKEVL